MGLVPFVSLDWILNGFCVLIWFELEFIIVDCNVSKEMG